MHILWKNLGFKYFTNANSFFHLFLTSVKSSRKLTRVIWSFGSHSGQFLNYKPTRDVPSRPNSTWAAIQTRGRTKFVYVLNYLKFLRQCPKAVHRRTLLNKIKKACWRQLPISKSKAAETIIVLCLPSFTKKGLSSIKQKKWTPLFNSAYSN